MSTIEMDSKIKELRELKRMQDELAAEIETIQDEIKGHMTAQDTDTLSGTDWKIIWKAVTSNRLEEGVARHRRPLYEAEHHSPLRAGMKRGRYPNPSKCG